MRLFAWLQSYVFGEYFDGSDELNVLVCARSGCAAPGLLVLDP
jgi:hypothetical protein